MCILKLKPALKDYLWGGTKLKTEYRMQTNLEKVAEAWVLSTHKDGPSTVLNGELAGKTLNEAIAAFGPDCLGERGKAFQNFPVLIKLIDAKDNLSVQVHPNDEYALRVEGVYGGSAYGTIKLQGVGVRYEQRRGRFVRVHARIHVLFFAHGDIRRVGNDYVKVSGQ